MFDSEHNPYESPKASTGPADAGLGKDLKPTPEEKRRWRRAVLPCIGLALVSALALCLDPKTGLDFDIAPAALTIGALAVPAIVAYWLILAKTGRRRLADAVFALWTAGWLAYCAYAWVSAEIQPTGDPVQQVAVAIALVLFASHAAAYVGLRFGTRRR